MEVINPARIHPTIRVQRRFRCELAVDADRPWQQTGTAVLGSGRLDQTVSPNHLRQVVLVPRGVVRGLKWSCQ